MEAYKARRKHSLHSTDDGTVTEQALAMRRDQHGLFCSGCNRSFGKLTIDHIIPLIKGGAHTITNIDFLCHRCNSSKRASLPENISRNRTILKHWKIPDISETVFMLSRYSHGIDVDNENAWYN